ncbi:hypothetical protein GMORB2_2787 [Geosmithia morbida]|uniref:DEUBAD domain-containing protein n=1 Tax=Geosmithia morbida TaxID=1094350 RepID=A0A9P5CYT1_9HYPO|nr:uncharacterized protein GMORB2_2787 [Geosmithia morbida]KAF4120783.1 hypothetical protein GMORB2_2787 [Geosmithia morbida]
MPDKNSLSLSPPPPDNPEQPEHSPQNGIPTRSSTRIRATRSSTRVALGADTQAGEKQSPTAGKSTAKKAAPRRRQPKESKWDAERMLTDPSSPLTKADLRGLLSKPMAWDVLNQDEKNEIISLFPDQTFVIGVGTDDARPNFSALLNDDTFRYDCASFVENLAQGRFDPGWLESAFSAYQQRKTGDFDDTLIAKFEMEWDVELPHEFKPDRGYGTPRERGGKVEDEIIVREEAPHTDAANGDSSDKTNGDSEAMHNNQQESDKSASYPEASGSPQKRAKASDPENLNTRTPGHNDSMGVDELQGSDVEPVIAMAKTTPSKRYGTKMEVDAEASDDELA